MAANETENYQMLYDEIKAEIEKAADAIKETKGLVSFLLSVSFSRNS
jgi:flagellin-specific chaperone FliS